MECSETIWFKFLTSVLKFSLHVFQFLVTQLGLHLLHITTLSVEISFAINHYYFLQTKKTLSNNIIINY